MPARHAVLLTPLESPHPKALLSRQPPPPISPLAATLMNLLASAANKRLTVELSPLDATLTKYRGDILRPKSFSLSSALRSLQFLSALQCLCGSSVFHLPYTLPSSVCCNSCVSHSCENCRGVHQQFPFWNSSLTTRHDTQVLSLAGACEPAWPHPLYLLPFQLSTVDCQLPVQSLRLRPGEK